MSRWPERKQIPRVGLALVALGLLPLLFQNCGEAFHSATPPATLASNVPSPLPAPLPTPVFQPESDSLRALASNRGFLFGTSALVEHLAEPLYRQTLGGQFNLVTAENAMKWAALHPAAATFEFTAADQILDQAVYFDMKVRGHNLAWHAYNPDWLMNGAFTPAQLADLLQNHIKTVIGHFKLKYPGRIVAWDVVNEALDDSSTPALKNSIWSPIGSSPTDYMKLAFSAAHAADPDALLFYNDYSNDFSGPKATATFNLVKSLKDAGVPIDGVGLQCHLGLGNVISTPSQLTSLIASYNAIGIKVAITEFDMSLKLTNGSPTAADLEAQPIAYHDYLAACLNAPGCVSFSVWGVSDNYSWIPSAFPGFGLPLIFDANTILKPSIFNVLQSV